MRVVVTIRARIMASLRARVRVQGRVRRSTVPYAVRVGGKG